MPADPLNPAILLPAALIVLVAGTLKGSIGFGFPLLAVPAVAMLIGTRSSIVVLSVGILVTNVLLLVRRPVNGAVIRRFLPMIATIVPSTILGSVLLNRVDGQAISVFVGVTSLLFALISIARVQIVIPPRVERVASPIIGIAAGVLYGATSILGPIFALYLHGIGLEKRAFVYGITLLFAAGNVVQVLSYGALGLYSGGLLLAGALLTPVALVGQQIGFRLQDRMDPRRFRQLIVVVVVLSSLNLMARGLGLY